MGKVVLDTNFILTCIRNKLDFFEELLLKGHRVVIPKEVIAEIKRLRDGSKALSFREEAELALKIIKSHDYEEIDAPGKYVDSGLFNFLSDNPEYILATLDKKLKKNVRNRKMVIRGKKKLELQ